MTYFGGKQEEPRRRPPLRAGALVASFLMLIGLAYGCVPKEELQKQSSSAAQEKKQDSDNKKETSVAPLKNADPESTAENAVSDKHFSVAEAAARESTDGKQALSVRDIYKKVSPSVVAITTEISVTDFFSREPSTQPSAGSGVIVTADGYILTCNHVIESANKISVMLSDKSEHEAKVVGRDSTGDLAMLKIEATGLTPAILGDSDALEVGELAVAIGNPLGEFANSLTAGVISALDRSLYIEGENGSGSIPTNLLQTDTSISPGNSGGALINSYGEVIGITSAKSSGSAVEGIGFAIPINQAKDGIEDLIKKGYISGRPLIGIQGKTVDQMTSEQYDIPVGVYIADVSAGGAADKAGLEVGDVITKFDGADVKTMEDLNTMKNKHKAGDTISLTIMRNKRESTVSLILDEIPPEENAPVASANDLPPEFRQYFEDRRGPQETPDQG